MTCAGEFFVSKLNDMKSRLYIMLMILVFAGPSFTQKIGFNINTPVHPLHLVQPAGTTLSTGLPLFYAEYTGTNLVDMIGIKAKCKPGDYYGIGADFEGGWTGVKGRVVGAGITNQIYVGVAGDAMGTGTGDFVAVQGYAHATGTADNFGIYGNATGGTKNWAGYFSDGNVHIKNRLAIGNTNPQYPVHINQPAGTSLPAQTPVMHVEYTGPNTGDVIGIRSKCVLPDGYGIGGEFEGGRIGIQGEVTANDNYGHFGVRGIVTNTTGTGFNVGLYGSATGGYDNYGLFVSEGDGYIDGKFAVGMETGTNKLEINGNASKSTAGDWLANSDARLKKNIQPLNEKEMIEKLLALKGVTYEWNDDKTGNDRPTGIQYGFTAQNIQEVFPTLVEEDAKGYLQTAYGTYDAMMIEALRYLYLENQSLKNDLEEIKNLIKGMAAGK
jgi:hypothetical protein